MRVISQESVLGFAVMHCLLEVLHTLLFPSAFLPTNRQSFEHLKIIISLSALSTTAIE